MEFSRITQAGDPDKGTPDISTVIFTTHHAGPADTTPLQMVSAEQVAYWKRVETDYADLLEKLAACDQPFAELAAICGNARKLSIAK